MTVSHHSREEEEPPRVFPFESWGLGPGGLGPDCPAEPGGRDWGLPPSEYCLSSDRATDLIMSFRDQICPEAAHQNRDFQSPVIFDHTPYGAADD